jgi:hypothetical protein
LNTARNSSRGRRCTPKSPSVGSIPLTTLSVFSSLTWSRVNGGLGNSSSNPACISASANGIGSRIRCLFNAVSKSSKSALKLVSDLRSFCKIVELPANRVIASTPVLRQLAQRAKRAPKPISHQRWCNILSSLRKALDLTGIQQTKFRLLPKPADAWQELLSLIACNKRRIVFLRFARYCTAMGIIPEEVDDAIIHRYQRALDEEAYSDSLPKIASLCRAWNQCAASLLSCLSSILQLPTKSAAMACHGRLTP